MLNCKNGKCYFSDEVNIGMLATKFDVSVTDIKNKGTEVAISTQYRLLDYIQKDELLEMLQKDNPLIQVHYSNETTSDTKQVKKTDKPIWDFNLSDDGKTISLKRV